MKLRAIFLLLLIVAPCSNYAASPADEPLTSVRQALDRGDKEQALQAAEKAVAADPQNAECYRVRAAVYDARQEFSRAVADYDKVIELAPKSAAGYQRRGEDQFRLGRFKESVADFDKVIELAPDRAPYHWQRGISLYYAGEFKLGASQFELHRTVNPEDVENAVWHYLCVARLSGIEEARRKLIPIRDDARVPMMQVYALFAGKATTADVLEAAKAGTPQDAELKRRLFYAHLYLGLFEEAGGHADAAREHIFAAAEKYAGNDYMGDVARVHAAVLKKTVDSVDKRTRCE